jgi:arsenate reductase
LTTVADNTAAEPVQLFHIPTCGTCRKAIAALKAAGVAPALVDLRQSPPDAALLAGLVADSRLPPRKYKAGGWAAQAGALDAAGVVAALAADPMLIKRPVVVRGSGPQRVVLVGFDAAAWAAAGLLPTVGA